MRRRVVSFFLALACAVSALCLGAQPARADDYIAANHTRSNGLPYYIMVDRVGNTVTVYGLDENGYYTVPARTMVCSVGLPNTPTLYGNYTVTGYRRPWLRMIDGSYGQYATQFYGNYLFHSVCYSRNDPSALLTDEYNLLGSAASHGCVRLQTVDAKWIYDNCAAGTRVTIYDGSDPDPADKPDKLVSRIEPEQDNGWDPTDPREQNPWHSLLAAPPVEIALREDRLLLTFGQMRALSASLSSDQAGPSRIQWSSSDPAVATVSPRGIVTAQGAGNAVITAAYGDASASCTVAVRRVVLPFDDVDLDIWYYDDVCYAYENGILNGTGEGKFSPGLSMTYSMMAQVLYRMAGQNDRITQEGEPWYAPALRWADEQQITAGLPQDFEPNSPIPRQDLVSMLYQYETVWLGRVADTFSSLSTFSDGEAVGESARDAMAWAVAHELVRGTESGELLPAGYADRAQFSAILRRYLTQT